MPSDISGDNEIKESLDLIQKAIMALDKKIEAQGKRIDLIEKNEPIGNHIGESLSQESQQGETEFASSVVGEIKESWVKNTQPIQESDSKITYTAKKQETSLEENIGGKWFARIGIAALILGVSFFLKYAFDNDWIDETGRVLIGVLIGLVMLGLGEKTIRKYFVYGQVMSGGGIAVLYLSVFSAFNFYQIIGPAGAFFVMVLITIAGILLSLRYDAPSLMMVATVGGFATPLMASTGQNNEFGLLSYVALLDVAILTVSVFKKWRSINVAGFLGTFVLFSAWGDRFYTRQDLNSTMFFLTLFFVIFSISSLIYNLLKKESSTGVEQLLTLATAVLYFGTSYSLLNGEFHPFMGFLALVLALYYFLWAYAVRNFTPTDENLYGFLAFLAVGFVTLAIPIQFKQHIVTMGWAIEAVLLMIIGVKLSKYPVIVFSIIVSVLTALRYLLFDVAKYDKYTLIFFNNIFLTAIILILAAYVIAFIINTFLKDEISGIRKKSLVALFVVAANFITIFSISTELTASYDRDIQNIYSTMNSPISGSSLGVSSQNSIAYQAKYTTSQKEIQSLRNKSSITLSIFWLIYAVVLLAVGISRKFKEVRVGGLFLLALAILKLFFVDLWSLGTLYRIISSMSLGVVLLLISFAYQKYKDAIKEII